MALMHWLGAIGMTGLVISAVIAGRIPNDEKKATKEELAFRRWIMHNHESVGLIMLALLFPRLAIRFSSKLPARLPEAPWQIIASKVSHTTMLAIATFMPISGLAFGYLSGWGVPFFVFNVPGASKEAAESPFNKKWEKFFYENHHRVGWWLTYVFLPLHLGALVFTRTVHGKNLLVRMWPWGKR